MRRAVKNPDSEILTQQLQYVSGNSHQNKKIATLLLKEQKNYCVYTDEFIGRTDALDVEHFNPTLKDTAEDGYDNWFMVKHQWNLEKSTKWEKFQPVLHPTHESFESRIIYMDGSYVAASDEDMEAANLVKLLKLDDPILSQERRQYIVRKRQEMEYMQQTPVDFFTILSQADPCQLKHLRAIKEVFGIDIWQEFLS